ncbi:hypothetical protein FACS1894174_03210 [Bacteroidia bacterium]|nr:hypothetical protein FACS1894174_03210 [Bacteroidia bacterium]
MRNTTIYTFLVCLFCTTTLIADDFRTSPQGNFETRKKLYLDFCIKEGSKGGRDAVFNEIMRIEAGVPVNEAMIRETVDFVYTNIDCNDFAVGGLVRLIYLNKKQKCLSPQIEKIVTDCLLDFKYWWNDSRRDTVYRCYHTENHQALCHSDELLAGQFFKDKTFSSGKTGLQHTEHATVLIKRWMDYRFRFGFSEWLSNHYYEVDLMILANLYDFAEEKEIRDKAKLLLDVTLFDMAINNYKGVFGSTHGRSYSGGVKGGRIESTSPIFKLMFGVGSFNSATNMGAAALASSSYRCPEIIEQIATDYTTPVRTKERQSINVEDAPKYGLSYTEKDLNFFWGMQEFIHPFVIKTSKQISERYDVWPYRDYDKYIQRYEDQKKQFGKILDMQLDRFALSEANIETYRTGDYMLSCVNDYRKGAQGYQQHIWQATLGVDAVVFTTHPGATHEDGSPNYWGGNARMPRATQHKNVVICVYNIPEDERINYSHAYFPRYAFDEVIEQDNWIIARKDKGYIALYSHSTPKRKWDKHGKLYDYVAQGRQNTWICEMGSEKESGSFKQFTEAILSSKTYGDGLNISYQSPSLGKIEFGWEKPLFIQGKEISITGYPRFNNIYSQSEFNTLQMEIKYKNKSISLEFEMVQIMALKGYLPE